MLTGGALYMDAFENLHAVWKWPSNHRKTISAFLIFVLPIQMDFAVILDTVPLPLNHLMWWRWLGSLICSSNWIFLTSPSKGKKKPNKPPLPKNTTQPKKCPMFRGRGLTQAARAEVQLFDFCKMQGVTLLWWKPFCLALRWSKAGSFAGCGWKKAIRKFLLLSHDTMDKNNLAISHAWEENNFSLWRQIGII